MELFDVFWGGAGDLLVDTGVCGDGREDNVGVETASGVVAGLLTVTDILGDSAYERNKYREGWRKVVYERLWRMVSALKSGFAASAGVILLRCPYSSGSFMRSLSTRYY